MDSTIKSENFQTSVVARVAGEDIRPGDFVTITQEIFEFPSFLWSCSGGLLSTDELVRLSYLPHDAGLPFKVKAVCLPFVYAKRPHGKLVTIDIDESNL